MNAPTGLIIPPHAIEAEQSLLGGLLLQNDAWDRIGDLVCAEDFYRDDHRRIFRHIAHLIEAGRPADVVTVFETMQASQEAEQAGGMAYLGEIANSTPSAANIKRYAEIVREKRLLRDLICASSEIHDIALQAGREAAIDRIDRAQGLLVGLAEKEPSKREPVPIGDVLGAVIDEIQTRFDSDEPVSGLKTGFADLDTRTCGLQPGDLVIVAGRPSMGKSGFAINIAEHVAVVCRQPALVFSLEMSKNQLATRALASIGQINIQSLRSGRMTDDDFERMTMALSKLHEAPLIIDDTPAMTAQQIRTRARRVMRKQGGLSLIVIDYLQLMRGTGDNRHLEISAITKSIKALAKELDVPIILLSQLSRGVEARTNKRPMMSDLRESGSIEEDADLILLLYRDEYYNHDSPDAGLAEIIIGKQRMGPTGTMRLVFQGEYSRFRDADSTAIAESIRRAEAKPQVKPRRGYKED